MNKHLHNTDNLFSGVLSNYSEAPDDVVWEKIEHRLNKCEAEKYKTKYNTLKKFLLCSILTCLFLLAGYLLPDETNYQVDHNQVHASANKLTGKSEADYKLNKVVTTFKKATMHSSIIPAPSAPVNKQKLSSGLPTFYTVASYSKNSKTILPVVSYNNIQSLHQQLIISSSSTDSLQSQLQTGAAGTIIKSGRQKHLFSLIPYFSFDHITGRFKQQYVYNHEDVSNASDAERPDMSHTEGLLIERGLSSKFSLRSGLLLSDAFTAISGTTVKALQNNTGVYSFMVATKYGLAEVKHTSPAQPGSNDSIVVSNGAIHVQSVAVPLLAVSNIKRGRLSVNLIAGGNINYVIADKAELEYTTAGNFETETVDKLEGVKKVYLSLVGGGEALYLYNKKLSVGLNPVIRYAITPINKGTPVTTYPVSIGLGASVHIKL